MCVDGVTRVHHVRKLSHMHDDDCTGWPGT